ncbi:protein unc-13 homolog 4B-like [Palaemon carinicauda]|uniref:protein unc-13 homolog 4B-like n=1 Tax=Palaemon carinicauda TaxID=392227 RepID=UPI0035B5F1BB
MGQALNTMTPSKVLEGEVEVCHEATSLLQSLEEHRTQVLNVSTSEKLMKTRLRKGSFDEEEQIARVRRALGIGDLYEDDMEKATSFDQMDEQLADVLYALHFLSLPESSLLEGNVEAGQLEVDLSEADGEENKPATNPASPPGGKLPFSRQDLQRTLMEVFDVDEATIQMIYQDVQRRQKPQVTLHLHIIEAKDLRRKTSKGTTNSYCVVKVSGSDEVYKTEVQYDQLAPFWDSPFLIKVTDIQDAKLTIQVWHEPQESGMEHISSIMDLKEISRAVLGTNEFKNLLGSVTIPLENIKNKLVDKWYTLMKKEECKSVCLRDSFRGAKKRGSIHLSMKASVKSELNLLGSHWYDTLLNKLLQHRLGFLCSLGTFTRDGTRCSVRSNCSSFSGARSYSTNSCARSTPSTLNSTGSSSSSSSGFCSSSEKEIGAIPSPTTPWAGAISNIDSFILTQYGSVLNMTPPLVTLSWWKITSKLTVVDQAYLGDVLKDLFDYIKKTEYSEEETKEVQSSLRIWASEQDGRLKNLQTNFPTSSRVISQHQLTHTLRNLKAVESNTNNRKLQIFPDNSTYLELVTNALTQFTKNWWEKTLQNCDCTSPNASEEQQLEAVVFVTGEVLYFLMDVCNFYEAIVKNETGLSYLKLSYLLLTSELAARIRPLIRKMYDAPIEAKREKASEISKPKLATSEDHSMDERRPIWQLYRKLGNIAVDIGEKLPEEAQQQCGITGYHSWFIKVVMRWQEQMLSRSKLLVQEEVEKDNFEEQNGCLSTSTSASEVTYIFKIVKTTWTRLSWPYEIDGDVIVNKLLATLCCIGKHYTKLVIKKLKSGMQEGNAQNHFFSLQTCVALNNIEYLRQEIRGLPVLLMLSENEDNLHKFTVIVNTLRVMEKNLLCFIDTCVNKIKPTLRIAIVTSCDTSNEVPLLNDCLDGDLCHLKRHMNEVNLQRILFKIWNSLISIFSEILKENAEKRKPEYFNGMYKVLDKTWHFLTPADRSGLDPQVAHTTEYQVLKNDLSNLKMGTESLIANYYRERYEEQLKRKEDQQRQLSSELVVHVYFTDTEKLYFEVIMARNVTESKSEENVRRPLAGRKVSLKLPDTYVQVKMVPTGWFPGMNWKTKTQKKQQSPVFQENFEVSISSTGQSAKAGLLLFTVKTSQLVQDGFVGEAILPLDMVPCVEQCNANNVAYKYLSLTVPKEEEEYLAVKALKFRKKDKKALVFLKELKDLNRKKGNGT